MAKTSRWKLRKPSIEVLQEMLRVGRHAIVSFPNYGHWSVRLSLLATGRAPRTKCFPYDWHSLSGRRTRALLANLTAEVAVFLVRK